MWRRWRRWRRLCDVRLYYIYKYIIYIRANYMCAVYTIATSTDLSRPVSFARIIFFSSLLLLYYFYLRSLYGVGIQSFRPGNGSTTPTTAVYTLRPMASRATTSRGPAADDDDDDDGVGCDACTTAAAARDGAAKISGRRDRSMYTRYTHTARGRLVRETRAASATVERREKNR